MAVGIENWYWEQIICHGLSSLKYMTFLTSSAAIMLYIPLAW